MMPIRYLNAFLLSTLTFAALYFAALTLNKIEKPLKPAPSKVIQVALITPVVPVVKPVVKTPPSPVIPPIIPPMPVAKKVEEKKPLPIVKPKPKKTLVKKKVVKKKVVKKVVKKKIVKKKVVKKKVVKKPVVKKKIVKKVEPKVVESAPIQEYIPVAPPVYVAAPQPVVQRAPQPTPVPQAAPKNNHHRKAFLRNVRSKIIANKRYPKIAKRRHIEGSVKVRFDITKQGQVSNVRFINGKSIFQKSIRKTLERTFPMGIPAEVQNDLPIMNVSVVLHFNLR